MPTTRPWRRRVVARAVIALLGKAWLVSVRMGVQCVASLTNVINLPACRHTPHAWRAPALLWASVLRGRPTHVPRRCCAATPSNCWAPSSGRQSRAQVGEWVGGLVDGQLPGQGVLIARALFRCAGAIYTSAPSRALLRTPPLYLPAGQPSIISKDVIEDAMGSVVLALSVVMAGSGHLPTFKLLRGA